MNPRLAFVPPKIDYERRNYPAGVQGLLEAMVQRDPQKRFDIAHICRMSIVKKIFVQLSKEEAEFNK